MSALWVAIVLMANGTVLFSPVGSKFYEHCAELALEIVGTGYLRPGEAIYCYKADTAELVFVAGSE